MCCIVSRSGRVPLDIPLFHDPEQLVALYTGAPVALEGVEADIDVDAASPGFAAALRDLRTRRDVRVVLCEGGPRVVGALLAQGPGLSPPVPLELIRVLESDGYLFLRYLVAQPR
jgi:riboflavin biosynthesis pyrimidine reductase